MDYKELETLTTDFNEYAAECEAALRLTIARILNVKEAMHRSPERSPFDSIASRIKTFDSVVEKCKNRGYDIDISSIKKYITDVAGIRVVTPFRDDIYKVAGMIEHIPGINVIEREDYVAAPKSNGYSSLHLNVQIEIFDPQQGRSKLIPVEIQIRDKSMDMWATIEHIVRYKNDNTSPEVEEKFQKMADILAKFDKSAMELRDSSI